MSKSIEKAQAVTLRPTPLPKQQLLGWVTLTNLMTNAECERLVESYL